MMLEYLYTLAYIDNQLIPDKTQRIGTVDVPLYMLGDSAYSLQSWLTKPFPYSSDLTTQQHTYNYRISRGRIVAENAFGRLKARWRRLMKRNDMYMHNVHVAAAAACVLHNICEIHHDQFNDAWVVDMMVLHNQQPQHLETSVQVSPNIGSF